jgi:hypothetical protein
MMIAPRPRSTSADLARVLACWLAVIIFLQGIAAVQALGRGPLHRHAERLTAPHAHHHDAAERHHHELGDLSVLAVADMQDSAFDTGAFALTAALALMALASAIACAWRDTRRHVRRAAPPWAWRTHIPPALRKPPRLG